MTSSRRSASWLAILRGHRSVTSWGKVTTDWFLAFAGGDGAGNGSWKKKKGLDFYIQALVFFGGDEEDRTPGLRIANAALSQLSYIPGRGMPDRWTRHGCQLYSGRNFPVGEKFRPDSSAGPCLRAPGTCLGRCPSRFAGPCPGRGTWRDRSGCAVRSTARCFRPPG